MLSKFLTCSTLAVGVVLAAGATQAFAAGEGAGGRVLLATAPPSTTTPGCPAIRWHLVNDGGNNYKGVVYFADFSGASILNGTMASNGTFRATVKSVAGTGPSGTVTGRRSPDGVTAVLNGPGCSKLNVNITPPQQTSTVGTGAR